MAERDTGHNRFSWFGQLWKRCVHKVVSSRRTCRPARILAFNLTRRLSVHQSVWKEISDWLKGLNDEFLTTGTFYGGRSSRNKFLRCLLLSYNPGRLPSTTLPSLQSSFFSLFHAYYTFEQRISSRPEFTRWSLYLKNVSNNIDICFV